MSSTLSMTVGATYDRDKSYSAGAIKISTSAKRMEGRPGNEALENEIKQMAISFSLITSAAREKDFSLLQ
jgi:hypothetical protein